MPPVLSHPRIRAWRTRVILERDYRSFRRRYGDVIGGHPAAADGVALVASLTHSVFQLKLEGMISKAFQHEGVEPVALVPSDTALPRRYLELFGLRRFVTLSDYLSAELEAEARREAERALASVDGEAGLKALTFRGAGIGRQALSTVSRHLHEGRVDLSDARTRDLLVEFLGLSIRTALASERLLADLRPDVVLFNERNYAAEGPLSDLALERGLNVIQFVGGYEDDALVFKRYTAATRGLHPRSLAEESWATVREMPWTPERDRELDDEFARRYDGHSYLAKLNLGNAREQSTDEIVTGLELDPSKPTAVVFSHVLWDANMFYGRDLFDDQEQWFVETVRAATENDRVNWVVKLHPANVWKLKRDHAHGELDEVVAIREQIGRLPAHVRLLEPASEISPWSLFGLTDVGVTIRGSIGFELPCFGVPVLTAGTGFYAGRGFTVDSETADEYLARLRTIEGTPRPTAEQVALARRHAYGLFKLRQTRFSSFRARYRPLDEIDHPFEATIDVQARTRAELEQSPDLRRLGSWAVRSHALDYLEEPS